MTASSTTHSATGEAPDLDVWVEVETPEQIAFSYSVAGIGSRGAAAVIDVLICVGTLLALFFILYLLLVRGTHTTKEPVPATGAWLVAVLTIAQFIIVWGYYVLFEGIWDGQTPGKRIMNIRVVRDGGYSVTFAASAVRNLVRALDAQPLLSLSRRDRRGDVELVAQADRRHCRRYVRDQGEPDGSACRICSAECDKRDDEAERRRVRASRAVHVAAADAGSGATACARRAARDTIRGAASKRRHDATRGGAGASLRGGAGRTRERCGVAQRYRRAARAARDSGAGLKRWNDFASAMDAAYARGLARMRPDEVSALVGQYREIATDLARLQTATRGRNTDAKFYLSRLVAGRTIFCTGRQYAVSR